MPGKSGYESVQRWRKVPLEKRGTRLGLRREEDLAPAAGTNLSACRDDYLEHLAVKNYRPMTINGRRQNLLYFLEWAHVRDLDQPGQITRKILEGYCRWLHHYRKKNGKPLSVKSQRDRIQVLKQFFSYLCKQDRLDANPASEIEIPRAERRLPRQPFTVQEMDQILAVPDVADPLGLRDRAILETLYSTGIRRSEAVRLEVSDLNASNGVLFIRLGKGAKDRYVPVGKRALSWLTRYLEESRPLLAVGNDCPALFLTALGGPFNPDAFGTSVAAFIQKAGLGRRGGCHLFRHTCATHMLEGGADIRYIQQLLGHAQLDSTSIYTRVSIKQLQEVHARCHPAH